MSTEKDTMARNHQRESATTLNLLKALPADQADLKPHAKSRTAKELAFVLANQERFYTQATAGIGDFALLANPVPATMAEVIAAFEANSAAVDAAIAAASVEDLNQIMNFAGFDMRRIDVCGPTCSTWFITAGRSRCMSVWRGARCLPSTGRLRIFRVSSSSV